MSDKTCKLQQTKIISRRLGTILVQPKKYYLFLIAFNYFSVFWRGLWVDCHRTGASSRCFVLWKHHKSNSCRNFGWASWRKTDIWIWSLDFIHHDPINSYIGISKFSKPHNMSNLNWICSGKIFSIRLVLHLL